MYDRYNCSKTLQFFAIIIFLIMIDRDNLILLFPKKFIFREIRRASIMHRLTDKKFSLREKIMATFMFILSAVLVFIIYKTNSISALGVNSYRIGNNPGSLTGTSFFRFSMSLLTLIEPVRIDSDPLISGQDKNICNSKPCIELRKDVHSLIY